MNNTKRTKIVATLGPATDDDQVMENILAAGVDMVRINFSHGQHAEHQARIHQARNIAKKLGKEIAVLADLQGPKIRIARFEQDKILLEEHSQFCLDASLDNNCGNEHCVGITYKDLPNDVREGDTLLLDDGRIVLDVKQIEGAKIHCTVNIGGVLSNNKGINRLGGGLSAEALTDKDRVDLKFAVELQADYIAISFPRHAEDIVSARKLIQAAGGHASIIAKIERREAVDNIDDILDVSEAVMVARGDLGVEIGAAEVPGVQKLIIRQARLKDRAVITATQMMESMITSAIPTRAEVSDVANAVLDGTDAVMLSAETATGKYPHKAVKAMVAACLSTEKYPLADTNSRRKDIQFESVDAAIATATMFTANHLSIKAILCLTETGSTPLWMSRINSEIPIYALSRHLLTQRKVNLYRGVYPIDFDPTSVTRDKVNYSAVDKLKSLSLIDDGDLVIITKGDFMGKIGGTNSMKIVKVGQVAH